MDIVRARTTAAAARRYPPARRSSPLLGAAPGYEVHALPSFEDFTWLAIGCV